MAEPFQPTITRYYLQGVRVLKGTKGARKRKDKSPTWWGSWQDPVSGKRVKRPLADSFKKAKQLLDDIHSRNRRIAAGEAPALAVESSRPLAQSLKDYLAYLRAKGDSAKHVERSRQCVTKMLELLGWQGCSDVRKAGVLEAAASLREGKPIELPANRSEFTTREVALLLGVKQLSLRRRVQRLGLPEGVKAGRTYLYPRETVADLVRRKGQGLNTTSSNYYIRALKGFTAWLESADRLARDPLRKLRLPNAEPDRRRQRRALAEEQFLAFVDGVAAGPVVLGLTGPERLVLYTLAANTGLRAGELASLTPESFEVDSEPHAVWIQAGQVKARKLARQPLRPDVAELLRAHLVGRDRRQPLWPGRWSDNAAEMVRHDLAAAGIEYISEGKFFDFHSLRGQFATLLAAAGVHPRVAQALLRHSNIELTMKHYTHTSGLDTAAALDKLPPLPGSLKLFTGEAKKADSADAPSNPGPTETAGDQQVG